MGRRANEGAQASGCSWIGRRAEERDERGTREPKLPRLSQETRGMTRAGNGRQNVITITGTGNKANTSTFMRYKVLRSTRPVAPPPARARPFHADPTVARNRRRKEGRRKKSRLEVADACHPNAPELCVFVGRCTCARNRPVEFPLELLVTVQMSSKLSHDRLQWWGN